MPFRRFDMSRTCQLLFRLLRTERRNRKTALCRGPRDDNNRANHDVDHDRHHIDDDEHHHRFALDDNLDHDLRSELLQQELRL